MKLTKSQNKLVNSTKIKNMFYLQSLLFVLNKLEKLLFLFIKESPLIVKDTMQQKSIENIPGTPIRFFLLIALWGLFYENALINICPSYIQ